MLRDDIQVLRDRVIGLDKQRSYLRGKLDGYKGMIISIQDIRENLAHVLHTIEIDLIKETKELKTKTQELEYANRNKGIRYAGLD